MSESAAVRVELVARTDVGLIRAVNQDSFLAGDLDGAPIEGAEPVSFAVGARGPAMIVCDGMGGAAGGEVASDLAARVIWAEMRAARPTDERPVYARLLRRAVRLANRRVFEEAQRNPHLFGMGTTVSAAGLVGDALLLAQVGDSRAYIHRGSILTQVTRDQSIASALVHAGRLTPTEARTTPQANMILQALGVKEELEVAISIVEVRRGDTLLLCSDGLHGPVDDERLRATLSACPDLDEAGDTLIRLARAAGAPDNVTAVIARFTGDGLKPPMSPEDLPRFVEFNPMEEGERALTTTSWVARRLAAEAGIGDDPGPPPIPATGQHAAYQGELPELAAPPEPEQPAIRPVEARLAERSRLGLLAWITILLAALAVGVLLLWDSL
jgi:serine/threonine protein phosphatase PrpC